MIRIHVPSNVYSVTEKKLLNHQILRIHSTRPISVHSLNAH